MSTALSEVSLAAVPEDVIALLFNMFPVGRLVCLPARLVVSGRPRGRFLVSLVAIHRRLRHHRRRRRRRRRRCRIPVSDFWLGSQV